MWGAVVLFDMRSSRIGRIKERNWTKSRIVKPFQRMTHEQAKLQIRPKPSCMTDKEIDELGFRWIYHIKNQQAVGAAESLGNQIIKGARYFHPLLTSAEDEHTNPSDAPLIERLKWIQYLSCGETQKCQAAIEQLPLNLCPFSRTEPKWICGRE